MMKDRYLENNYVEIWFENGLVHEIFKPQCVLTLESAEDIVRDRLKVSDGKMSPIFIDLRNMVSTTNAARSYMASTEAQAYLSAGALLINNEIHQLLLNLWLKIDKPFIPTKGFTDKQKALLWLEQYKYLY
jgi:hypothetical protein